MVYDSTMAMVGRVQDRVLRQKAAKRGKVVVIRVLDPLLATLAHFDSNSDLTLRIDTLFNVLDIDDSRRSVCVCLLPGPLCRHLGHSPARIAAAPGR